MTPPRSASGASPPRGRRQRTGQAGSAAAARSGWLAAGDALARPHPNCYWVLPGRLLGGEYPLRHLEALHAAGVTDFIDLTADDESLPGYQAGLAPGQRRQRFSITDYSVPGEPLMRTILAALRSLLADPTRRIYLHCQGGVGRTGTVVGCLLVESGFAPDEALDLLARKWQGVAKRDRAPESPETAEQRACIARWQRAA